MTQLPLRPKSLTERITVRVLSRLLHAANAIAPTLDEWEKMRLYRIKDQILTRLGDAEPVMDVQEIVYECRGCYGSGVWGTVAASPALFPEGLA